MLYLVATPIGNLGDFSPRARQVLEAADIVACEDTRTSRQLFSLLGIQVKKTIAYHDFNEEKAVPKIIEQLKAGVEMALVSDAGMPLISDPGYKLIRACREQGIEVTSVPGPNAVLTALQLSGLPTDSFYFGGFLSHKNSQREKSLLAVADLPCTLIFYETANRLTKTLEVIKDIFANREISVAREITKLYEECKTGSAQELLAYYTNNQPKGEIVLIVAPSTEDVVIDYENELKEELKKSSLKTAVKSIVEKYNLNKNDVYQKALELKNG
jgi:16S rRNA (cytidine1402-2'-O)-methyltransferase